MTAADVAKESFQFKRLWRELPNLELNSDKILHRKGDETSQVILPSRLKSLVFKELHVDMGHLGYEECFFWSKMYDDVKYFVTNICKCIKDKTPNTLTEAPLKTITSSSPMELIGLDFLHLDTCTGGFQYLLVITDHFTRYTQLYPTRNKETKIAATKLFNDYILRFGTPGKILHDQGREFESKLFTHLSKLCNIKRLRSTPYHHQCNGQVERMNRSIIEMLKTLE